MTDWPHAPIHRVNVKGTYMVTGSTAYKQHFFKTPDRLEFLQNTLLKLTKQYNWTLQAWAIFSNHYHFIALSPENPQNLVALISQLHVTCARHVNSLDQTLNREVWWQYWDTRITFQPSYLARLNYVHKNPVRHKLVESANLYPWCSASWFEKNAPTSFCKTVYSLKTDAVKVIDDFECEYE